MAQTLYISEFSDSGYLSGAVPAAKQPGNRDSVITVTATSQQSSVFLNNTRMVRIQNDNPASPVGVNFLFGTSPTAVANTNARLAPNQTEYFVIPDSQIGLLKVAVINAAN